MLKVNFIADKDYLQSQCATRLPENNRNIIWKVLVWNYFPFCSNVYCIWWPHMWWWSCRFFLCYWTYHHDELL